MKAIAEQTVLITGSTDGLGKNVALKLAEQGSRIILHGRDPKKGEKTLEEIIKLSGNEKIKYYNSDFSSLQSVRDLGAAILKEYQNIDMLINNAGIYLKDDVRRYSQDKFELNFAVNYLAPFLLTHLLIPALQQKEVTKIINISSGAQHELDFDNVMLDINYNSRKAYAQSKLALIMFTFTLAGQLKDTKIRVNALHPENLMNTKMVLEVFGSAETSVEQGTEVVLHVSTSPEIENITGAYFDKKEIAEARAQANDLMARDKLYRLSREWVKI
ncbi:SDR family NAD(P)-dependent oxidoreductase [Desertivirga brevis]|uniref:SDR family NAD(P)-dependent oxidoreductase n=1 Tax=Desertivirga brevis TaxID=2810310 RepID=UPI001A972F4B|nr:SDR family NAD(P)-dependent oxidoreductase [Pedobacter sp. SYSU D00873]